MSADDEGEPWTSVKTRARDDDDEPDNDVTPFWRFFRLTKGEERQRRRLDRAERERKFDISIGRRTGADKKSTMDYHAAKLAVKLAKPGKDSDKAKDELIALLEEENKFLREITARASIRNESLSMSYMAVAGELRRLMEEKEEE